MGPNRTAGRDPLSASRAKRSLARTPEPGGRAAPPLTPPPAPVPAPAVPTARAAASAAWPGGLFVVHMHAARRLHWDLRLEMDGVLAPWAVPEGPLPKPGDKRLAVPVAGHPLDCGD